MGIRGDVTVQMDDCLGRLRAALAEHGYDDCLFIFSSDNGPVINDGYWDGSIRDCAGHNPVAPMGMGHYQNGKLAGGKYGIMEGSTCVPFIVCRPGYVPAKEVTHALVSQIDLARSLAVLAGVEVPADALPDSRNELPALIGQNRQGAPYIIEQGHGHVLAIRQGAFKYYCRGKQEHLYNLSTDPKEEHNIAPHHPDVVQQLRDLLQQVQQGRNT